MPVKPGKAGVAQEMKKFGEGKLHSGSKTGPVVKSRAQAIAISLSEAGLSNKGGKQHPSPHLQTHHPHLAKAWGKK